MNRKEFQSKLLTLQSNLYDFAMVLTSNRDDANDLVQDTALKVLDNEDKFEASEASNFRGWVFTIMRNIFINKYRRMVRSGTFIDRSDNLYQLNVPDSDGDIDPEESMEVGEISSVINSFPEGYRRPFTLLLAGYKYGEIAERMHLPVGTIKSRIFYARRYLRNRLSDYNPD